MISPVSKISTSQSITKISTGLQCGSTSLRRKSLFGTLKAGSRRMHFTQTLPSDTLGISMQRPSLTGTCCSGWKLGQLKICRTKVLNKRMTLTAAYSHFSICVCWSKKDPSRKIHTHRQQSSYMQRK